MPPLPDDVRQYPVAWIRVDAIDGCSHDAQTDLWTQPLPFARPLVVRLTLTNRQTAGPIADGSVQFPKLVATMVRGDASPVTEQQLWNQNGEMGSLAPGRSLNAVLSFEALTAGSKATKALPAYISIHFYSTSNHANPKPGNDTALGPERRIHLITGIDKSRIPKV